MGRVKGFTLLEAMMAMAISLSLLSTFMILWVAMSKSSHRELKRFERQQDYIEAVSYVRHIFGRAIYRLHCPNIEWLVYQGDLEDRFIEKIVASFAHPVTLHPLIDVVNGSNSALISDLGAHASKLARNSNVVDILHFTPLLIEEGSKIINIEEIKGTREGYILATDCRNYVVGQYQRNQKNDSILAESLVNSIGNYLSDRYSIQYYKVNRELLYVIHENGEDQLIHNFLDGSNYMRLYGIDSFAVSFLNELDRQLLLLKLMEEDSHIRLYNL